jgi:hypothetical protein
MYGILLYCWCLDLFLELSFPTLSRVLVVVVDCWFRNKNPEPQRTEVDTTYQELDLSKMNTEDHLGAKE